MNLLPHGNSDLDVTLLGGFIATVEQQIDSAALAGVVQSRSGRERVGAVDRVHTIDSIQMDTIGQEKLIFAMAEVLSAIEI